MNRKLIFSKILVKFINVLKHYFYNIKIFKDLEKFLNYYLNENLS